MLAKSKVKYIQSLGQKKSRDAGNVFIAEGPRIVKELIESRPRDVNEIYALKEWIDNYNNFSSKFNIVEVDDAELQKISQLVTPNQVLALVNKFDEVVSINAKGTITIVLDTIRDPGNFGTIIRIADWFGIEQVVCSHGCADIYNPKVVQSSMGSIARVKMIYTDIEQWLIDQDDVHIYATVLEGQDVTAMKKINEGIIIIGNESKGIREEILKLADTNITIPKKGKAESLNAAVAAGIVLSHII